MTGRLRRALSGARRRLVRRRTGPSATAAAVPAAYRQALVEAGTLTDIVLVVRRGGLRLAEELAREHPGSTVHLLVSDAISAERRSGLPASVRYGRTPDLAARLRRLSRLPRPQLVIERGLEHSGERIETFRALFGLVVAGGHYVVDSVPSSAAPEALAEHQRLAALLGALGAQGTTEPAGEHDAEVELGLSLGEVTALPGGWVLGKRLDHQWKIRDRQANKLLAARYGVSWGEVVDSKPAVTYASRARPTTHGEGLRTLKAEIAVPERWLRRYRDVTCHARKRARLGEHWLPDTFRNQKMRVLSHRALHSTGPYSARVAGEPETATRVLDGAYFYLDSEYFSHFGHVLTDVIGNTWGWQRALEREPGVRPLLSLPPTVASIPGFQRQIFAALDIDPDTVEYVRPGQPVRVTELYGCSSDWAMPRYCAPELAETWARIAATCRTTGPADSPELVFIGRRPRDIRTCHNAPQVEAFFAGLGFAVVYPEDLPFGAQIDLFARARVVAGFAGSGMFNAMFAPDATLLVLTGDSYTATNEYLIKAAVGGDIHYFWTPAELRHPEGGWTWEAFRSNFVFDLDRFGPEIAAVVAGTR